MIEISTINQVKRHNVFLIKQALKSIPSGSKNDVAKITGLSVATCNTILNELSEAQEIIPLEHHSPSIGRPPKLYRFNESLHSICCIYLINNKNAFKLHYAVSDLQGSILTEGYNNYRSMNLSTIIQCIEDLYEKYPNINVISLGLPGYYHNNKISTSGRTILDNCDIIKELTEHFSCEVYVENDMNAMAYGLYYFRQDIVKKNENITLIAMLKKGSLGAGAIIDGKILHGDTSFAGEILNLDYPEGKAKELLVRGKSSILSVAARLVIAYSVIVNPAVIVFTGDDISEADLETVHTKALDYIPEEHMPRLLYKGNFEQYYLQGLIAISLGER